MDWFTTARELSATVRGGEISDAIIRVSEILKALPDSPFHRVLDLNFTNEPDAVARHFDSFLQEQKYHFKLGAVYTETNGFDINPDRWYFDLFAYREYGGHEDYDWLSDWESGRYPDITLTGMESLQRVYQSDAFHVETYRGASEYCSLLVVCKFQDLIRSSVPFMSELEVPLLATSHDYDFIAEFAPRSNRQTR